MTIRVESISRVVDPRVQLWRDEVRLDPNAVFSKELNRGLELLIIGKLQAEGHVGCFRAKAEFTAPRFREQAERVMFVITTQKRAALALPLYFFSQHEAHHLLVPSFQRFIVVDKKVHRADAGNLERLRQQQAIDAVLERHLAKMAPPVQHADALFHIQAHEFVIGKLRLHGWFRSAMAHRNWARVAVPADLLDAVVELKNLLIRRPYIKMKLRTSSSRSTFAHDLDSQIPKVFARLCHLADALDLPSDLVDVVLRPKVFGVLTCELPLVELLFIK